MAILHMKRKHTAFFVGNGINKLFERALPEGERTEENVLKIRSQFIPYYDEHNADLSRPYPGISELLKNTATARDHDSGRLQ